MLSTNKKNNDGALVHIKLPNILPEIFQIILRYIYSGRISLEDTEILGGYNPIEWESNNDGNFGTTNDSFIFSFMSSDDIESYILSRVRDENCAIFNYNASGPRFGDDLVLSGDFGNCYNYDYEKKIRENDDDFYVEEYEVFQILN
ncbi:hypothetical protein GLOIN_2v1881828 [Rhizophagus irregularis DAOM 181602=DAOM 197198]|nr:hypothetical protein GLOIN_2v1881828 [Rhizophagus irregularis DAOM 181602=DAOM 197198]